jgi:hypothetical protein
VGGLPIEAREETEQARGHIKNRFECPAPNMKRPRTCLLAESGQTGARPNQRGNSIGIFGSVEQDVGRDEEDSTPSLKSSSIALIGSYPDQGEVEQDEATPREIPFGWTRVKLEPDC